jgi:hypothetical protein
MPRNPHPIDEDMVTDAERRMGFAIHEAFEPKSSFPLTTPDPNGQGLLINADINDGILNLFLVCGSSGILEYMLQRDGGPNTFVQLPVVKGQTVKGNFKRIGPNTTVYPLVAFVNG